MTLDGSETILQPQGDDDLSSRQRDLLSIVVRTYTGTAAPVGSTTIAENFPLGISSATIRNELAYLESCGYLTHPHTSAGRLPTEKGYRYFVEQLMQDSELPLDEQRMIRHQFYQVRMDLEHWMRLTAAVLAHTCWCCMAASCDRRCCPLLRRSRRRGWRGYRTSSMPSCRA
jgi:heat-inducible transcriptional repressor